MKYINKATGAIVDVQSKISGAWEPLEVPSAPKKEDDIKPIATPRKRKTTKE